MCVLFFSALMLSLVTIYMAPDLVTASLIIQMRRGTVLLMRYLLESSQYECLVRMASAVVSMGSGPLKRGWWPLLWPWVEEWVVDVASGVGMAVVIQMEAVNQAMRFTIVQRGQTLV